MRTQSVTALSLALLLGACAVEDANQAGNDMAETNGTAPASPGAPSPSGQPGRGEQAPEPFDEVSLTASPNSTEGGSTMTLTLLNSAQEQIGYNLCTSTLETSDGTSVPTGRECTIELRTLEPGRSADYRYRLPVNMLDGSYRFVTQIERMQSGRRGAVRSNSFQIRAD